MDLAKTDTQNKYSGRTNDELLLEYKRTKDSKLKQELVLRYIYVVKSIALQMRDVYASFAQIDDIINEGVLAIMNAIDKFDIDKNVKFETYISKRIRGMVVDLARKQDWVPRSVRKAAKDIDNATMELYNQLGRFPSPKETADYMNLGFERYQDLVGKTSLYNMISLDMVLEENSENKKTLQVPSVNEREQPEDYYLEEEFKNTLADAIRKLKENEQKIISLYYVEELNMKEIARIMQISEPRVSQVHANAIQKLRVFMENFINGKK